MAFWTQTGERQTARLRLRYLQSVLRKKIEFFDTDTRAKDIIFHISSDAILVQDAIGDKVRIYIYSIIHLLNSLKFEVSNALFICSVILIQIGHTIRYISQFLVGFAVGFLSVWQLTLLTLAVVPLIAVAGGTYTLIMSNLSQKGEAAYAEAGKVAEEVKSIYLHFSINTQKAKK